MTHPAKKKVKPVKAWAWKSISYPGTLIAVEAGNPPTSDCFPVLIVPDDGSYIVTTAPAKRRKK